MDPLRAARVCPSAFARYATNGRYKLPPHVRLLERKSLELTARRINRLAVSVPPRHGKSEFCSRFFPAWYLGNFPDHRIILASYESDFAAQWGRKVRDLLTEHGPAVFGVSVRHGSHAANRWDLFGREGGMQTVGAGGALMGKGANLLIIDDPHKNWQEVFSETIREDVWEWYQSTASSRLEPGAVIMVLQQRWHEHDLLGHLLDLDARGLERWSRIDFPALAEQNDILGRRPGEALWPERYNEEKLLAHKRIVHSKFWEAQYQQHPTPLAGGLFKKAHARRYRMLEAQGRDGGTYLFHDGTAALLDEMQRFITVDTATSTKTSADQTSIAVWGLTVHGRLVLLDLYLERVEGPTIMREIREMARRWVAQVWIEENSTAKHLLSFMEEAGIQFDVLKPGTTDKWTRAWPAAGKWERGEVSIPEDTTGWDRDFLAAFERQLFRFAPDSGDDDAVDCFAYAARIVLEELTPGSALESAATKAKIYLPPGIASAAPPGF